jgi:hypothetical protein
MATQQPPIPQLGRPDVPHGSHLLKRPVLNKDTAFTEDERGKFGLHGLLPPHIESLDVQSVRAYEGYKRKDDDLERHIYLRALQDANEVLFYKLLLDHIEEMTPNRLHTQRQASMAGLSRSLRGYSKTQVGVDSSRRAYGTARRYRSLPHQSARGD